MIGISKDEWYKLQKDFVEKFPIDQLLTLPIEKYTNLNRNDSLCYWLESETYRLGSIWGSNSYKFGIFKYNKMPKDDSSPYDDEYTWNKKCGDTRAKAYQYILAGLYEIAKAASVGDFDTVEKNSTYGDLCKWKLAFIYSGMKLIPIYSKEMLQKLTKEYGMSNTESATMLDLQRFLLSKQGGKDMYDFYDELLKTYDSLQAESNVWMIKGNTDTFKSPIISMGDSVSSGLTDYSQFKTRLELGDAYRNVKNNTDVRVPYSYWHFIKEVKVGDIIVVFETRVKNKSNNHLLYGWGIITSELINDIDSENPLQRRVEWKVILEEPIEDKKTKNSMFFHGTTKEQADNIKELLNIAQQPTQNNSTDNMNQIQTYIDLLRENHNLVLTGAPGTGKTYLAKEIAQAMGCTKEEMCFVQFHPSYDYTDFVEGLRSINTKDGQIAFERKDGIFKKFCKNALEDTERNIQRVYDSIINDLKNGSLILESEGKKIVCFDNDIKVWNKKDNKIDKKHQFSKDLIIILAKDVIDKGDNRTNGVTKGSIKDTYGSEIERYAIPVINELLKRYRRPPYVFIIDEINRGDLSKIFGELFFCIDPGYRGKKGTVQTQYQNMIEPSDVFADGFYIPENVYIIATMNDIDRSVESMDFAMRRRFSWYEVEPKERVEMLDKLGSDKAEAEARMNRLNVAITEKLGSAFQIGPAYFLKLKNGDFDKLWKMNLKPLLHEYLRGTRNAEETLKIFEETYLNVAIIS